MGCYREDPTIADDADGAKNPTECPRKFCCTDIIFLIIFVAFWGLLGYISVYAIIHVGDSIGNPFSQESSQKIEKTFEKTENQTSYLFLKVVRDVYVRWWQMIVLYVIAVTIGSGFMVILVMRCLVSVAPWLIAMPAVLGSLIGTGFLWWTWFELQSKDDGVSSDTPFLILSIILTVCTVIFLLIIFVKKKELTLVVPLFRQARKCLVHIHPLFIQPLWTVIVVFIFLVFGVAIFVLILVPEYKEPFPKQFWWIHAIGVIWTSEFILGCQQFVIAGAVVNWYFRVNESRLSCGCVAISAAIGHLLFRHIGSIVLGSFIVIVTRIPRFIITCIRQLDESGIVCFKCFVWCCDSFLYRLAKSLEDLNQNAYPIVVLRKTGFITSAKEASSILTSNMKTVNDVKQAATYVLFVGKVGIMATTCAIAVAWPKNIKDLHNFGIPIFFVIGILSFLIAHCFLSGYEMVIEALLVCFCEDCRLNEGSTSPEYFMSKSQREFVKKYNAGIQQPDEGRNLEADQQTGVAQQTSEAKELNPCSIKHLNTVL